MHWAMSLSVTGFDKKSFMPALIAVRLKLASE